MKQEMRDRIAMIKKRVSVERYPICIEKFKITLDVQQEYKNEPAVIQRARTLEAYVERMPIDIAPGELIVGIGASKPMGLEIDPAYGLWPQNEIDSLKEDGYLIDPQDEIELQELNRKHNPVGTQEAKAQIVYNYPKILNMLKAGIPFPPWRDRKKGDTPVGGGYAQSGLGLGPGFMLGCTEFEKVLHNGSDALADQAQREMEKIRFLGDKDALYRARYYQGMVIALRAMGKLGKRYADLAAAMAEQENDPKRRMELLQIESNCRQVPAKPARNFREALQCFWFQFLMLNPSTTLPAGRFDQYMFPYYKADIESGAITRDEVLELLCLIRLKDMELNRTSGQQNRKKNSGMAKWHNFVIGGVDRDGNDATNDLTYLVLEAAMETRTPHHTITLRVHEGTPEKLMLEALKVVRSGLGMPAFIGDRSYIATFTRAGIPLEDAREYAIAGCLDAALPGKSRGGPIPMVGMPLMFDIFRHQGIDVKTGLMSGIDCGKFTEFKTFEDLFEAYFREVRYFCELVAESDNITIAVFAELIPEPLRSSLMWRGIEEGKDIFARKLPFENASILNPIGMVNMGDSFAAIKKLVFEQKKYTLKQLEDALEANWGEGYEEMQKDFLAAPKFGNDDDYVDSLVAECYRRFYEIVEQQPTVLDSYNMSTGISITSHQPIGALVGATPDGRKAKEILADGCVSPMHGMDVNGVTAVLKSALKVNQDPSMAELLNMKFHPSALQSDDDLRKLASLIKTYMVNGGKHIQFNVVSKETLRAAQADPQEHRDLIVRVAGYSAYFLQLTKPMQEEVIARNEHTL